MPAMRMPVLDILHRTLLFGLVGFGALGILTGVQVHRGNLRRGKEMEKQKEAALREGKQIDEKALAEAAQKILDSRQTQS
ncbi:hypothetical protein ACEPAG_9321 [Sanghuangporus baumii]